VFILFSAITCPDVPVWSDKKANTTQNDIGTVINVTSLDDKGDICFVSQCMPNGEWEPPLGMFNI